MQLLLFLNELSYRDVTAGQDEVVAALDAFIQALRTIRQHRPEVALLTEVNVLDLELPGGFSLRQWANDGRNRDKRRYLMALRNRAPFSSAVTDGRLDDVEHRFAGRLCAGLGAAYLVDGLSVSLVLGDDWDEPFLAVAQRALAENDEGDIALVESDITVRHVALERHVPAHQDWLVNSALAEATSGARLWELRDSLFPHLRFLPRVEGDLVSLDMVWLKPVRERLAELDAAVRCWDTGTAATPAWLSKVTPESESRRNLCWFDLPDGTRALFDLHARFTPGPGRLHFRIERGDGVLTVAYIGRKRGAG